MCPEERYDPTGQSEEATEVYAAPLTTLRNINRKGEREKERELTGITVPSLARENNNSAPARTAASGADIYCI